MTEFTVTKKSKKDIFRIDTPIIPEGRSGVEIINTGLAETITATFFWSHSFTSSWFEYTSIEVGTDEQKTLSAPSNPLYYSKVVITNNTDSPAYITANLQ